MKKIHYHDDANLSVAVIETVIQGFYPLSNFYNFIMPTDNLALRNIVGHIFKSLLIKVAAKCIVNVL